MDSFSPSHFSLSQISLYFTLTLACRVPGAAQHQRRVTRSLRTRLGSVFKDDMDAQNDTTMTSRVRYGDRSRLFFTINENKKERRERERRRSKGVGGALIERTPWIATPSGRISERREGRCRGDRQHRPNDRINSWPSALTITTSTRPSATSATISTTRTIRKLTNFIVQQTHPDFRRTYLDSMTDYVLLDCLLKE